MLPALRRQKQQLSQEECLDVLRTQKRGTLAVIGAEGYPYAVPMNHWYCEADGRIYFHGAKSGHKIDAMRQHEKVCFTVLDDGTPDPAHWWLIFRSVVVFGRIEWVEDYDRIIAVSRALCAKFPADAAYIEEEIRKSGPGTLCFAVVPEQICGKRVTER